MHDITKKVMEFWQAHPDQARERKSAFIEGLRENGVVRHACQIASISRRTVYRWRDSDSEFRAAWDNALEDATDRVEHTLYDLAVGGKNVVASIFYLKGNRPKYRENLTVDLRAVNAEIEERLAALGQPAARKIIAAMISAAVDESSVSTDETYQLGPANEQT